MVKIYLTFGGYGIYNIALEEHLLNKSLEEDMEIFRLWIEDKTIVIGASTELEREVDIRWADKLGIPIVRRQSGGGAVYHDLGNINFSIYIPRRILDISRIYRYGHNYILNTLRKLGLNGYIENGNDVVINGYKVSGSSIWIRRDSTLFHATLLVEADIEILRKVIKPRWDLVDKGIFKPSKYNPLNISRFIEVDTSIAIKKFLDVIGELKGEYELSRLGRSDYEELEEMVKERYSDDKWHIRGEFRDIPPLNLLLD